jgi:hypothetical protein
MGLLIGNGVSSDAADDTGNAPHRPNVYVTDAPRDDSGAPEQWNVWPSPYRVQSAPIDTRPLIGKGVSPDAADDTGGAPHRPNVYGKTFRAKEMWRPSGERIVVPLSRTI